MSNERKYSEDEVQEILRLASTPRPELSTVEGAAEAPDVGGMTLTEVQEIAREVGIEPDDVARAAARLAHRPESQPRLTHLGMPVGVGRSIDLPRAPSQEEWEELVVELRDTFRARGRVEGTASNLKSWQNSNLQVYVEPTPSGYRLRLRTVKGNALVLNRMGGLMLAVGGAALLVGTIFSRTGTELFPTFVMTSLGGLALAINALRLPGWAKQREEQMDYIASTARIIVRDDG